jgi:hypothetical protein
MSILTSYHYFVRIILSKSRVMIDSISNVDDNTSSTGKYRTRMAVLTFLLKL